MKLAFSKMHGAGNDFVVGDDSGAIWPRSESFIRRLCERRVGVGADGLILLSRGPDSALRMDYFNSDGSNAALCGNGLRCAALFAKERGLAKGVSMVFETASGRLSAEIVGPGRIKIEMPITEDFKAYEIDPELKIYKGAVGVPHAVIPVADLDRTDVKFQGRRFRFHPAFMPDGANVDFIRIPRAWDEPLAIRTYERGVEDETWACGTGATASAICARIFLGAPDKISLLCASGDLLGIELSCRDNIVLGAHLTGPAKTSFTGVLELDGP